MTGLLASAQFREFLDAAPDAMVVVGRDGRILSANVHTHTLFRYDPAELAGQPIEVLVPERFRQRHLGHRQGYIADPHRRPMGAGLDLLGLRKDGSEFPVEISLSPLRTDGGNVVVAAIRDVTDRKQIERALQEKNAELARANDVKDHFLASISHELRTPLNAIIGFTGTLLMRLPGPLNSDQEEQLDTIQTSARHLLSIINDLLDLAKIESGKVELTAEEVVCQSVLNEIASALQPLAEAKQLHFGVDAPPDAIVIWTNRRAMTQILINLTNNAIKFTDSGSVRLRLARVRRRDRPVVEIAVEDTGMGIKLEDQRRLFAAFEQLGSETRRFEGTGLGLHLSQRLAMLLGGSIAFTSQFGKGSTFILTLPEQR